MTENMSTEPRPVKFGIQWSSTAESRISDADRDDIDDAIDTVIDGNYRKLFPLHGAFGSMSPGVDGYTIWLYTEGSCYIAGELVDVETIRPRGVPASGTVNIQGLPPAVQSAIVEALRQSGLRR